MRYPAKIAALALLLAACGGGPPSRIEPKIDPDTRVLNSQSRASLSGFALHQRPRLPGLHQPEPPALPGHPHL
ncbi:MAG: hypothetical protein KatS3mg073_0829 [Meiothermus sp.]|nr:MAG: hypothetical protein KatS3mg073_0829 [Meiothermus sp.]